MTEDFLHYIWKFQHYNPHQLLTTEGERLTVLKAGVHNMDAGPDFFNSHIQIGEMNWAGNVEIHYRSSDWYQHEHEKDHLYNKIILHVVWEDDRPVKRRDGSWIPTLELNGRVSRSILEKYEALKSNKMWVPCEADLPQVDEFVKKQLLDRMAVDRMEDKSGRLDRLLDIHLNDWEEVLYQQLCRYFGFKVNGMPFEILATALPFSTLRKHQHNLLQLEALLFGQAGFLSAEFKGDYPLRLQKEYRFLAAKYQLKSMDVSLWKFMRMRPSNFPTIRLAQLAALLHENKSLFNQLIEAGAIKSMERIFQVETSAYWQSHFRFDVPAAKKTSKKLGKKSIELLLINVMVPLVFNYADKQSNEQLRDLSFQILEKLPPESNRITKRWAELGMPLESAIHSQALIQLKKKHCELKKCLTCMVGNSILKPNENDL